MTRFLEFIQPDLARLSLGGILSDIRTSMMDEVDFTKVGHRSAVTNDSPSLDDVFCQRMALVVLHMCAGCDMCFTS